MSHQVKEKRTILGNSRTIYTASGEIRWQSQNLQLMEIMEAVEHALLANVAPLEIARRIKG